MGLNNGNSDYIFVLDIEGFKVLNQVCITWHMMTCVSVMGCWGCYDPSPKA